MIVEGKELLDALGVKATAYEMEGSGALHVKGPDVDGRELRTLFWLDENTTAIHIADSEVRVFAEKGPLVSQLAHGCGTIVVFSTPVSSYSRSSVAKEQISARAMANVLGVELPNSGDIDRKFARDLFVAQIAMLSVLGDVIARAL